MDSTPDTLAHRQLVVRYAIDFCTEIMDRAEHHDESKLHSPEKERFDYVGTTQHLGKYAYGSADYKKSLEYLGPALEHHYKSNDHHPQHFKTGIDGMNLMQVVEMWLDWCAACKRNKDGNIMQSLEINKERFNLSDQLYNILKNTAIALGESENQRSSIK